MGVTDADALEYLGFLGAVATLDNPVPNDKTRKVLGWAPTYPGWIEDVEHGHYFAQVA